jgi:phosphoglycerate dehydrogenase-like enzyme
VILSCHRALWSLTSTMTKTRILITMPAHEPTLAKLRSDASLDITLLHEPVGGHGLDAVDWPAAALHDKDILFSSGVAPGNFPAMNAVKFVQMGSAGFEQFIPFDLPAKGIRAANARGVFDVPIAEWNLAMMIALGRDLRSMIRNQEKAQWTRERRYERELRGDTVGLWGYGGLARETARLLKTMGLRIHVLVRDGVRSRANDYVVPGTGDPEGKLPDRVFSYDQKSEFLQDLDFLIIGLPQTPATTGMIGEQDLRRLKPSCILLNPARGPIIQEQALLKALREGWISAAGLDTHYHYPMPPDHPLWAMPNVIMTPHISGSGATQNYLPRTWSIFAENVRRFQEGRPPLNELSTRDLRGQ